MVGRPLAWEGKGSACGDGQKLGQVGREWEFEAKEGRGGDGGEEGEKLGLKEKKVSGGGSSLMML